MPDKTAAEERRGKGPRRGSLAVEEFREKGKKKGVTGRQGREKKSPHHN